MGQFLMYFRSALFLGLALVVGCDSGNESLRDSHARRLAALDCLTDDVGCNAPFVCVENSDGVAACRLPDEEAEDEDEGRADADTLSGSDAPNPSENMITEGSENQSGTADDTEAGSHMQTPMAPTDEEPDNEPNPPMTDPEPQDNPQMPANEQMDDDLDVVENPAFANCPSPIVFTGQVRGRSADVPDGGQPKFSPYDAAYDADLDEIIAAMPELEGEVDSDIQITSATVVATSYYDDRDNPTRNQTQFWIADGSGSMHVRLAFDDPNATLPDSLVRVGQKISFRATKLGRDAYGPKIMAGAGFAVDDVHQPVYIWDVDRPIAAADVGRLARVTGIISGAPQGCGGSASCWSLDYGQGEITLRSATWVPPADGTCLTFLGPVTIYDDNVQLDTINFRWFSVYE